MSGDDLDEFKSQRNPQQTLIAEQSHSRRTVAHDLSEPQRVDNLRGAAGLRKPAFSPCTGLL
jgi:hypothetical protein